MQIFGKIKPPHRPLSLPYLHLTDIISTARHLMILRRHLFSKCFGLQQTTTPNEDDDTVVELADFEDVVQQGNHAENFLKHKIKASATWFTSWTSPALQTYYPLRNYGKSKAQSRHTTLQSKIQQRLACTWVHTLIFKAQNRSRIRQEHQVN